jgi:apolipoprotein N-acyltransferase
MERVSANFFARARARLGALKGWRRWAAAAALGALAVAALPPANLVFLLLASFTGFFWLVDGRKSFRGALADGWWFGFGFFAVGLYWIAAAFLVRPGRFAWMIPFAVFGLPAVLAVFAALAAGLYRLLIGEKGVSTFGKVLVFAAAWTLFEWLRGWVLTGFPWNLIGSAWTFSPAMLQTASLAGVLGLSLLTVIAAAVPAVLADGGKESRRPVIAVFIALSLIWAAGEARLAGTGGAVVKGVRLRLIQPNIDQKTKWLPGLRDKHIVDQIRMSRKPPKPGDPPPTHVIWAEAAAPLFLGRDSGRRALVGLAAPPGGLVITGALRADKSDRIHNSLYAIDGKGRILATYDKFHLVPFGEYVPLRGILRFAKITPGGRDFSPGPGPRTLNLAGLPPVGPLICYEVIFEGRVVAPGRRPGWLLNITNDGWYGLTIGPYQHFAAARMRAVEEGLPMVRVANTGISGVVDAYGRVTARLGLGVRGVLDADLPKPLASPTLYGRLGDWSAIFIILVAFAAGLSAPARKHRAG